MIRIQTILYPTDFSVAAEHALDVAHSLARDHRAKLVLLNVTDVLPVREVPLSEYDLAGVVNEARRQLEALAATINDLPVETHAVVGYTGDAIIDTARSCQADLIVMGTQGHSGLTRLLLGSVAEKVLRHAPCPVLTVKPGTEPHLLQEQPTDLMVSTVV
jgi:universal stress protein A